jgi:hypothetical protein
MPRPSKPAGRSGRSVLEGWVLLSIADHSPVPDIDGKRLEIREVA